MATTSVSGGPIAQLQDLPIEVFQQIIKCLTDEITTNKKSGYPHSYYTPNYSRAQEEIRRSLLALCLSSRKLNASVTPFLYHQVVLLKGIELTTPELKALELSPEGNWGFPDRGILTLGLFLRTMLERPELRSHVRQLDLRFFLLDIIDNDIVQSPPEFLQAVQEWEFGFLNKVVSCAKSEYDCAVLDHVGLSNEECSGDLAQRTFTAILCLIPMLRTLAFPPPPREKWFGSYINDFDEDQSISSHRDESYYHTTSSLLKLGYSDTRLSPAMLQNLETVRLTFVPGFTPPNSRAQRYGKRLEPAVPADPDYTFQIDACLGVLLAPNLKELETDMDAGIKLTGLHNRVSMASLKIERAFLTTSAFIQDLLEYACDNWPLTVLTIRPGRHVAYENLSDASSETDDADIDVWNTSLKKRATTLKTLDIASESMSWSPLQQLSCLHTLVSLEHLRIGLPLLNTNHGFVTRSLAKILPPRLKTLTITDWFAAHFYEQFYLAEESWGEDGSKTRNKPRRYRRLLSSALHKFSQTCGSTHPLLRSVMVFGLAPVDGPRYADTVRALELAGPEPGQVIVDAEKLQEQFALFGVAFREFFHGQELDHPFRVVHVD